MAQVRIIKRGEVPQKSITLSQSAASFRIVRAWRQGHQSNKIEKNPRAVFAALFTPLQQG